jgi:hypothetical protein
VGKSFANLLGFSFVVLAILTSCQDKKNDKIDVNRLIAEKEANIALTTDQKIHAIEALIPVQETLLIVKSLGSNSSLSSSIEKNNTLIGVIRDECFVIKSSNPLSKQAREHNLGFNTEVYGSAEKKCPASLNHKTIINSNSDGQILSATGTDLTDEFQIKSTFVLNNDYDKSSTYLNSMGLSTESKVVQKILGSDLIVERNDQYNIVATSSYYDNYTVYYSKGKITKGKVGSSSESIFEDSSFETWTVQLPEYTAQIKTESRKVSSTDFVTKYFFNNKEISKANLDNILLEAKTRVTKF